MSMVSRNLIMQHRVPCGERVDFNLYPYAQIVFYNLGGGEYRCDVTEYGMFSYANKPKVRVTARPRKKDGSINVKVYHV